MSRFKGWLDEEYGLSAVQKAASRYLRAQNPKDAWLPLAALVLYQAAKLEKDKGKKDILIEIFDMLTKLGG